MHGVGLEPTISLRPTVERPRCGKHHYIWKLYILEGTVCKAHLIISLLSALGRVFPQSLLSGKTSYVLVALGTEQTLITCAVFLQAGTRLDTVLIQYVNLLRLRGRRGR